MNQTSSPFEKTLLMMEIERRDIEIMSLNDRLDHASKSLSEASNALADISSTIGRFSTLDDQSWQFFLSHLDMFDLRFDPKKMDVLKTVIESFLKAKVGFSAETK